MSYLSNPHVSPTYESSASQQIRDVSRTLSVLLRLPLQSLASIPALHFLNLREPSLCDIPTQRPKLFPCFPPTPSWPRFPFFVFYSFVSLDTLRRAPGMASTTTSFSGFRLGLSQPVRTNGCNRTTLFAQPPRLSLSFFPAKPKSLKALKSKQQYRSGAFPNGFQRFGRTSRPFDVRCEASNGRVTLLVSFWLTRIRFYNSSVIICGSSIPIIVVSVC